MLNALTIPTNGSDAFGYFNDGGIGWSFTPTVNMFAVGVEASAPQVSFWLGSNQVLATFEVSNPSMDPSDSFTTIAPLLLIAGQPYFITCQNSNFTGTLFVSGWAFPGTSSPPPYGPGPFSVSPELTGYASYFVSASGQWSDPSIPPNLNSDELFYGPNFEFLVVPEPGAAEILFLAAVLLPRKLFSRFTSRPP
jgi:hypothetical protein